MHVAQKYHLRLYDFPFILFLVVFMTGSSDIMGSYRNEARAGENISNIKSPLKSGCEIDYPPFCLVGKDGQAGGFSVELLEAALKSMGREVTFRTGTWTTVRGWLENGEIQVLPLVGRTPEREPLFDFTFPYMSLHGAIVVPEGTIDIHDLRDLKGRQVAVMKGENAEEFLRREDRGINIRTVPTFEQALKELSRGLHDAVVMQRLVALRLIQQTGLTNLHIVNKPVSGFQQDFCFAVREGDRETLSLLNEGLALIMADGTYRHLHAKWFADLQLPFHRSIAIGGDDNYPPFEYLDEKGRPTGFVVELTRAIAREVGLDISFRMGTWTQALNGMRSGRIDVIQGLFYSPDRDLKYDFTPPHSVNHYVVAMRKGRGEIPSTPAELRDLHIVVQKGDIMQEFAVKNGLGHPLSVERNQEDALRALVNGKYDCALVTRIPALYLIRKNGWTTLTLGKKPLLTLEYCYAVPNGHKALLAQFSEGLKILEKNGEYRRIYEKWLGVYGESSPGSPTILRYILMVALPLLALALFLFIWSWLLRKQVARRTLELATREKQYRLLANNTLDVIWTMTLDFEFTYVNPAIAKLTGYTTEEWIGSHLSTHCDEEGFARASQLITDGLTQRSRDAGTVFDIEIRRKDGGWVWVEIYGRAVYNENDMPANLQGVARDISQRKRDEQRIDHLNRVLRAIRDVNQLIVRKQDTQTFIRQGCSLLVRNRGYASSLIALTDDNGQPVSWATSGMDVFIRPLEAIFQNGELPPCCRETRSTGSVVLMDQCSDVDEIDCLPDSASRIRSMCTGLIHDGTTFGYLVVALDHDLNVDREERSLFTEMAEDLAYALYVLQSDAARKTSEQKQQLLERQLIQAQKMESVGRLAGGVAHDYNNMLSIIIGYAELALEKVKPGESLHTELGEILCAARRSTDITRQLLAFARRQTIAPKVLNLNDIVTSMLKMLRRLIGEDIDLAWLPGAGVWPVKIDPSQVDQILANLCVNARDAIAGVGKITIETKNVCLDKDYCADHAGFVPGEYILLAVSDDGTGMSPETLEKVFEPFFTTKKMGEGTGLGLSTVYGIVKQNDGFINIYSELGKGSTIRIYLARHAGEGHEEANEPVTEIPLGRGETLLLVEDDGAILLLGKKMLENLGYTVLTAATPGDAMALARESEERIHLLITDVVMPEMSGRDLSSQLQVEYPDLKVLFMSGYTADVIAHRGVLDEGVNFISKPFSKKELAMKVRDVLEH